MTFEKESQAVAEEAVEATKDIPVNEHGIRTAYLRGKLDGYKECLEKIFPEGEKGGEGTSKSAA